MSKQKRTKSRQPNLPPATIARRSRKANPQGSPHGHKFIVVRETIESIVVAFVLAFLFRTFEAEAFVIPTGSMSPALQGRHKDVECDQCGYRFRTTASSEDSDEVPANDPRPQPPQHCPSTSVTGCDNKSPRRMCWPASARCVGTRWRFARTCRRVCKTWSISTASRTSPATRATDPGQQIRLRLQ